MTRDHTGNVLFHGRDAFTPSTSRLATELRGIIWVLQSANDLHLHTVSIASDHSETIEAISTPGSWPREHMPIQ
ncbi:BnaC09g17530D [Brassica napus]|uniref:BnaC09g17530D protein n=1 Tax=Brassica napus TaxID=3708 RepID=A0A078I1Y9_BRANA|nr:BnaC09g17530D [Brassica napus]